MSDGVQAQVVPHVRMLDKVVESTPRCATLLKCGTSVILDTILATMLLSYPPKMCHTFEVWHICVALQYWLQCCWIIPWDVPHFRSVAHLSSCCKVVECSPKMCHTFEVWHIWVRYHTRYNVVESPRHLSMHATKLLSCTPRRGIFSQFGTSNFATAIPKK